MMMMKLELTARAGSWLAAFGRCATAWFVASGIPLAHVAHAERAAPVPALPALQPLFDYPLRDTSICVGGDGQYYLTGTTGAPDWWAVTGDIQVWKSSDLATWTPVVEHPRRRSVVWNIDREGTWEKPIPLRDGAPFRPLWAPEITYLKGTYWIAYSIPLGVGGGLLKSTTGKPEGPYESVWKERPLVHAIDLALFGDDDGKVYLIWADGQIAQLNDDLTAFAEKPWKLKPRDADRIGFEGTFVFKANGRYYITGAEFVPGPNGEVDRTYDCFAASAENLRGPYGDKFLAIPHAGHNSFFQDRDGRWWATFFGNDSRAPIRERPAILPIEFTEDGRFRPMKPVTAATPLASDGHALLAALGSPVLFAGDARTAYRDPLLLHADGWFWMFFSLATNDDEGRAWWQTAWSRSRDLQDWSPPATITPRDRSLNFCSPGSIVRRDGQWVLALQTYPTPGGEKYGNDDSRLWLMRSTNLEDWGDPELLHFLGPGVPRDAMPRMIDPSIVPDKDEPGKWWCFCKVKQTGVSMAWSRDLKTWHFEGRVDGGENACVIVQDDEYVLFHSPENGIGIKRSPDLRDWRNEGVLTLGQRDWPWARGRISAGYVLDARKIPGVGRYVMVFHGSGPEDEQTMFSTHASIGIAWSDDLNTWRWPGSDG